jgi:hypothetical protein
VINVDRKFPKTIARAVIYSSMNAGVPLNLISMKIIVSAKLIKSVEEVPMSEGFSFDYPEERRIKREREASDSMAAYNQQVNDLKAILRRYGNHDPNCSFVTFKSTICTCGFTEALRKCDIET